MPILSPDSQDVSSLELFFLVHLILNAAGLLHVRSHFLLHSFGLRGMALLVSVQQGFGQVFGQLGGAGEPGVALAGEPAGEEPQIGRRGSSQSPVAAPGTPNAEVSGAEVEVVVRVVVSTHAAAVPLAQEVAAELGGGRHVGYVGV